MTPSFPISTDNIYKFACLFGLALIIVSIFSFVSTYTASLDRKVKYMEIIIPLEAKTQRNKAEDDLLLLNKKLVEVAKSNEGAANAAISAVLSIGLILSAFGAYQWHVKIQLRDDQLAHLQMEKLAAEIAKIRREIALSGSEELVP